MESYKELMIREIINNNKANWFVKHIEEHLKDMPEVKDKRAYCKICNKDIDTIADEKCKSLFKEIEEFKKTLEHA